MMKKMDYFVLTDSIKQGLQALHSLETDEKLTLITRFIFNLRRIPLYY